MSESQEPGSSGGEEVYEGSASDEDSSSVGTDYSTEAIESGFFRNRHSDELKKAIVSSQMTCLDSTIMSHTHECANQDEAVPGSEFQKIISEEGKLIGFKMKAMRSSSVTSIRSAKFHIGDKNYPMNFARDFVLRTFVESGDMSMREAFGPIGDEGDNLTPDIIEKVGGNQFIVVELATRATQAETPLKKAFKEKMIKYMHYLAKREELMKNEFIDRMDDDQQMGRRLDREGPFIKFCVLAVGPTKVVTNVRLNRTLVDELCIRYRFGSALQPKLAAENLVKTPESELDAEMQKIVAEVSNFKMSSIIDDSDLINEGFPEYTRRHYTESIIKGVL